MALVDQFGREQVRLGSIRLLVTQVEKRRAGRKPKPNPATRRASEVLNH
jgi:hypothetical protein